MGDRWDRERWRTAAERLLAADMGVDERCALNHVSSSALYRRLAWFRDNEPEVLGGWEAAHAGDGEGRWLEAVRAAARGAALPSALHAAPGFVEVGSPRRPPGRFLANVGAAPPSPPRPRGPSWAQAGAHAPRPPGPGRHALPVAGVGQRRHQRLQVERLAGDGRPEVAAAGPVRRR